MYETIYCILILIHYFKIGRQNARYNNYQVDVNPSCVLGRLLNLMPPKEDSPDRNNPRQAHMRQLVARVVKHNLHKQIDRHKATDQIKPSERLLSFNLCTVHLIRLQGILFILYRPMYYSQGVFALRNEHTKRICSNMYNMLLPV